MITIEITRSPDRDIINQFKYFRNEILIGSSESCDLVIKDSGISGTHFLMRAKESGLFCRNYRENDFYLSNGKKISGSKMHKVDDVIEIGDTSIRIVAFELVTRDYKSEIRAKYEEIDIMMPETQGVLSELEKELIRLEGKLHASK